MSNNIESTHSQSGQTINDVLKKSLINLLMTSILFEKKCFKIILIVDVTGQIISHYLIDKYNI